MAPKFSAKTSLFLLTNILLYVFASSACNTCIPGGGSGGGGSGGGGGGGGGGGPTTPGGQPGTTCPRDALKLGVCANLLGGLVGVVVGNPPTTPCCSLLAGLVDLEAAVCLCTAIRANILGINLNVPVSLSLLLNACGRGTPSGFTCA